MEKTKEMKNKPFAEAIKSYLDRRAAEDPQFAESYANPKKSISECCDYIVSEVSKQNRMAMTDDEVYGDAEVYGNADYLLFRGFGSANRVTTAFKTKDGGVAVKCGCFYGTLVEFAERVSEVHGDTLYGREYRAVIEAIKIHFELE